MNKKRFYVGFAIEIVLCLCIVYFKSEMPEVLKILITFPFVQIASALRNLSLSSSMGNGIAFAVYILLGLLPIFYRIIKDREMKFQIKDSIYIFLSISIFIVLYRMINPIFIIAEGTTEVILCCFFYMVILGCVIFRYYFIVRSSSPKVLSNLLSKLLIFMIIINIFSIFTIQLDSYLQNIEEFKSANTARVPSELVFSEICLFLQYIIRILPNLFTIGIVIKGIDLLREFDIHHISEKAMKLIQQISKYCVNALFVIVGANIAYQLLQIIFIRYAYIITNSIDIPLLPIIFLLIVLLFTHYVEETKKINEENEMFI